MEQLLTPQTLAAALGLAEQTIYNRHSTGGDLPPAVKLGRLLRFRPSDVESWLERQQQVSKTPPTPVQPSVTRRPGRPTKTEQVARRTH